MVNQLLPDHRGKRDGASLSRLRESAERRVDQERPPHRVELADRERQRLAGSEPDAALESNERRVAGRDRLCQSSQLLIFQVSLRTARLAVSHLLYAGRLLAERPSGVSKTLSWSIAWE